ncbi:MAG TPA: translation initiation factor IF-2, partial [Polyangia bacterium]
AAAGKKLKQTQITTPAEHKRVVRMADTIAVAELAKKMGVQGREIVKKLWALGMMGVTINQDIDLDTATLIANEFGYQIESTAFNEEEVLTDTETPDNPEDVVPRAPVVTIMGHVDHGKTSLLDAIRKANVAAGEAGGITQHIGAYKVHADKGDVVFLDTPGHEAFTAMRARGAQMTDIVVLVVAADDGPMPQTIEAINHAKEAKVPIIVAVNKIDKPGVNPDQIRNKLSEHGLVSEQWGGDTIFVNVSAKTKQGIDELLENLSVQAEVLDLKANPNKQGKGHVVEARLDRARGPISTVLVEDGTLKLGDLVVAGEYSGKIRAMLGDKGQSITEAGPSTPVEVLGLDGVPDAGEVFNAVTDEKAAKSLVEHRHEARRKKELAGTGRVSLENILDKIKSGEVKEVKVILKADVQGSVEAVASALTKLSTETVGVNVISTGVGGITESDVSLAKASSAVVIGFNVRPAGKAQQLAEQEDVDIKLYQVIYDAIDDVKKAMVGMLAPISREKMLGKAEVRQVFTIPKAGTIGGCFVVEGKITRKALLRLVRDSVVIYTGKVGSLRRFKDDASEVAQGYECGLSIEGYNDLRQGDVIEAFEMETIAATLDAPKAS